MSNIIFGEDCGALEVKFEVLDRTKQITFNSVDYAAWSTLLAPKATTLALYALGGGSAVTSLTTMAPQSTHATWSPNVTSSGGLVFQFGPDGMNNVIDNLNFTISAAPAVPETATWLSMIVGFGAIGAVLRKRTAVRALALA